MAVAAHSSPRSEIMTDPSSSPTTFDEERAISVLMLAFSADPAVRWVWPDPRQYLEDFPRFARVRRQRVYAGHCLLPARLRRRRSLAAARGYDGRSLPAQHHRG